MTSPRPHDSSAPFSQTPDHAPPNQAPTNIPLNSLIFPEQPSLNSILSTLRRSTLSIHNRLSSIHADADFASRTAAALQRPLVANERCGSWYVAPRDKAASAYFKSTDGHERAWKFSTRRLNLHLLDLIERHDGIIIVDSTRRGKRMPDALAATVPIWCAVLNRLLLPDCPLSAHLFLPPHLLPSTHASISALVPSFLASLRALRLDCLPVLSKPLRPIWITPQDDALLYHHQATHGSSVPLLLDDYRPIVCCTASRMVRPGGAEAEQLGYIQGAADDTENWAHGLTPLLFWQHVHELLATPEADLPALISSLISQPDPQTTLATPLHHLTPHISVTTLPLDAPSSSSSSSSSSLCHIALMPSPSPRDSWIRSSTYLQAGLGKNKAASRSLRLALPDLCAFAASFFQRQSLAKGQDKPRVVVACESARDLAVGVALALSCQLFTDSGQLRVPGDGVVFTKPLVKTRLASIMTAFPEANPSRQTLQSVNSYLMDWRV
ncbi:hypothetical protein CDD81_6002 [Ophiocordyceps australis]|uniref:Initiator tRNA phosphoribosyl transferase n=1 Tax=Ophiocordyceps australis TaxID=1399860 RepID=A0A2C5Y941_9HYPO|nr:hypothetical protein CDD81_6002 [Ophiocordyceps australis]